MAKAFSVASWNVKHFRGDPARTARVAAFLSAQNPDIFALYEVTGKETFGAVTSAFPGYTFQITEGPQTQEILLGIRNSVTCFVTQRVGFKSGVSLMRPGLLATVTVDGENYTLLFLHLASSAEPRGMGLRDDMLDRAVKFRHTLDKAAGGKHQSKYIFLGDLNTMGLDYPFEKDIDPDVELKKWDDRAGRYYGMKRLAKTHDLTWSGGSGSSYEDANLDHVFASKNLSFRQFDRPGAGKADVSVRGWVGQSTTAARDSWISDHSDHSLLYFEVQKV